MAKELVYRVRVTTDKKAFSDFRRSAVGGQQDVERSIRNTTQELNRQIELLDLYRQKGEITSEELSQGFKEIDARLKDIPVSTRDVIRSQKKLLKAQQAAGGATQNFAKAQSNANQTLFSFGDIVNDAQQFQFGFAQGTRAIGNNIGFLAEQFANTSKRAGGFKGALKSVGASLLGPGGIILAINVAVTALTVFGDELFGVGKKAKESANAIADNFNTILDDTLDKINEIRGLDGGLFATAQAESDLEVVNSLIEEFNTKLEDESIPLSERIENFFVALPLGVDRALSVATTQSEKQLILQQALEKLEKRRLDLKSSIAAQELFAATQTGRQLQNQIESFGVLRDAFQLFDPSTQRILDILQAAELRITRLRSQAAGLTEGDEFQGDITGKMATRLDTIAGVEQQISAEQQKFANARTQTARNEIQQRIDGYKQLLKEFKSTEEAKTAIERLEANQRGELMRQAISQSVNALSQAFDKSKPIAVAAAVIDGILAVQKVLANVPPPFNFVAAGAMAAATAKNVQKILSTEPGDTAGAETGRSTAREGFRTDTIGGGRSESRNIRDIQPRRGRMPVIEINGVLPDTEIYARSENGKKQRLSNTRRVSSA